MTTPTESYWPATSEIELTDVSSGDALRAAAETAPDRIGLIEVDTTQPEPRRWTYAELLLDSERAARALLQRFERGSHIAVWAANCPEWIIAQFGLALAGMVLVTVNPNYRANELAYVLKQSRARGIFFQRNHRGVDMASMVRDVQGNNDVRLDLAICFDEFADFIAEGNTDAELPIVEAREPAMIQYTSGTTGDPKGALLNHFGITNNARIMALLKGQDSNTVNLAVAPLFHTAGCVASVLGTVQTGGAIVLPPGFDADSMLDLIEQQRVTYTFAVPTMLIALLETQAKQPRDLSSLETVFSGGAIVPIEVVQQVEAQFGARLIIGYGQTETSPSITHTRLDDAPKDKSETIGQAIPQVEVKIVNPETGATAPLGVSGELCTRGFHVMMEYFDKPEATAATIDPDGWLHTGDLCVMDERGYFRITGRLKDMIIRGGENIYPREIEEVLYTHPAIIEVAVIGIPDDYWGEQVGAVVTLKNDTAVSSDSLRDYCTERLSRFKTPKFWFAMDEIPTTASGKIQKFRLVEMANEGALSEAEF